MKNLFTLSLLSVLLFTSCDEDNNIENSSVEYATSGHLVNAVVQTSAGVGTSHFLGYFEDEVPTTVDLTQYTSYGNMHSLTSYKKYLFNGNSESSIANNLERYQVNVETKELELTGEIVTTSSIGALKIISDEVGLFTLSEDLALYVFNPISMTVTKRIEVPNAVKIPYNHKQSYYSIIYREADKKVFLPLSTRNEASPAYYYGVVDEKSHVWLEVIDLDTMVWESTAVHDNAQDIGSRGNENFMVDESGNIYITCQGSYGLDGKASVYATVDARPQILKIPAGLTEFDMDYSFNPVEVYNPYLAGNFAQFMQGAIYRENGIAYACISTEIDSARISELLGLFAQNLLDGAGYDELRYLVINSATSRWVSLDLVNKTVAVLEGIPLTAGYAYPFSQEFGGKFYFNVFDNVSENGMYEYDPATGGATKHYELSAGGQAVQYIQLQE